MEIDKKLSEIKLNIKEKERLEISLKSIEEDLRAAEERKKQFKNQLIKEEKDVKRLEGISLANLIHSLKGDKSDKLYEERREAIAAKVKYDEITGEIKRLKEEIEGIKSRILGLGNLQEKYLLLIDEKEKIIKSGNYIQNDELEGLIDEGVNLKNKEREINEAITAGEKLLYSLNGVRDILDSARNWGIYDMMGGGFISTMVKHSKIDEAQDEIQKACYLAKRFYKEISDVGQTVNININIDSFLTFADYFFDGIFVDMAVQSKINNAIDQVNNNIMKLNKILNGLERELKANESKIKDIDRRRMDIIEKAQI